MDILFVTSTRVGDAVLSTGLLGHLVERHPGARITVVCGPAAAGLFEAVPGLERIVPLHKMVLSLHWLGAWAGCAGRAWDLIVDLRRSPLSYLLPARRRLRLVRARLPEHRVRQLATVVGLAHDPPAPRLWITDGQRALARRLIGGKGRVLAVGPTANWRAKTWRPERFRELIERLTAPTGILPGAPVAVFGRDDERPIALRLVEMIPADRRLDLVGRVDLLEAYACLRRCAFYVGNDSGLMHLAAAAGIPTLGLFGPSPETHYAPWGPRGAAVRTAIPYDRIFPPRFDPRLSDTLMDSLSVDAVEEGARLLWRRSALLAA